MAISGESDEIRMWRYLTPEDRATQIVKGYIGETLDHRAKRDALAADIAKAIRHAVEADRLIQHERA